MSINEYLYNRYGEFVKVNEEVNKMIKSLFDPVAMKKVLKKGRKESKIEEIFI